VTNTKTAKIPEEHTCSSAQTKVLRQCETRGVSQSKKRDKKIEKREGGGGGGGTKKKVDKKRVAHNGVVGPFFIFSNLLKNRVSFGLRDRSVAFFPELISLIETFFLK